MARTIHRCKYYKDETERLGKQFVTWDSPEEKKQKQEQLEAAAAELNGVRERLIGSLEGNKQLEDKLKSLEQTKSATAVGVSFGAVHELIRDGRQVPEGDTAQVQHALAHDRELQRGLL